MDKCFVKLGNQIVNVQTICHVQIGEAGGSVTIKLVNPDKTVTLRGAEAETLLNVLARFQLHMRPE